MFNNDAYVFCHPVSRIPFHRLRPDSNTCVRMFSGFTDHNATTICPYSYFCYECNRAVLTHEADNIIYTLETGALNRFVPSTPRGCQVNAHNYADYLLHFHAVERVSVAFTL